MKDSFVGHHPIILFYYLCYIISSLQIFGFVTASLGRFIYFNCTPTITVISKHIGRAQFLKEHEMSLHSQSSWANVFLNLYILISDDRMMFHRRLLILSAYCCCLSFIALLLQCIIYWTSLPLVEYFNVHEHIQQNIQKSKSSVFADRKAWTNREDCSS